MSWGTDYLEAVLPILPKMELKGTFDVIEVAFELFGRNKIYPKVANFIYRLQRGPCRTS